MEWCSTWSINPFNGCGSSVVELSCSRVVWWPRSPSEQLARLLVAGHCIGPNATWPHVLGIFCQRRIAWGSCAVRRRSIALKSAEQVAVDSVHLHQSARRMATLVSLVRRNDGWTSRGPRKICGDIVTRNRCPGQYRSGFGQIESLPVIAADHADKRQLPGCLNPLGGHR